MSRKRISNKKVKQMMIDSLDYWESYYCDNGTFARYVPVCNRRVGLFKPFLKLAGIVSIKGEDMR